MEIRPDVFWGFLLLDFLILKNFFIGYSLVWLFNTQIIEVYQYIYMYIYVCMYLSKNTHEDLIIYIQNSTIYSKHQKYTLKPKN